MAVTTNNAVRVQAAGPLGPSATIAARRTSRAGLALGGLGLATAVFVLARVLETWRVQPAAASHHIALLGLRLSYPTANFGAVVILAFAAAGLLVLATAALGAGRELLADRRFRRGLAALEPRPLLGALVIDDPLPQAFCAGLIRPRVYISTGAVALLDQAALSAVLTHERQHAGRRDPLRRAAGRVLASALFYIPGLDGVMRRAGSLAEISADEQAIAADPQGRSALASAMLKFADHGGGVNPERIDQLLGEGYGRSFPLLLCLAAGATVVLVAAVALLAGRVAAGSATLAPPFLSSQPCVLVLAGVPAVVGLITVGWARGKRRTES
jgi:hypothetical protein